MTENTTQNRTDNPVHRAVGRLSLPLRRPLHGRIVAGVAAGVAEYFDVDVAVVRIAAVVLTLLGGMGIPAYLAAWLLIPEEDAPVSIAEDWLERHHEYRRSAA